MVRALRVQSVIAGEFGDGVELMALNHIDKKMTSRRAVNSHRPYSTQLGTWITVWGVSRPHDTIKNIADYIGKSANTSEFKSLDESFEGLDPLYGQLKKFRINLGRFQNNEPFLYFMGEVSNDVWATGLLIEPSESALLLMNEDQRMAARVAVSESEDE